MSNSLDQDQDQHSVSPDLGPNCKQRLSIDNKNRCWQDELTYKADTTDEMAKIVTFNLDLHCLPK